MKKVSIGILIMCATSLMAGSTKVGNSYFHDDGSFTTSVGGNTFNSNGSMNTGNTRVGNTNFNNSGSYSTQVGNSVYNSNGSSGSRTGNRVNGNGSYYGY